jgi:hypothetical protein
VAFGNYHGILLLVGGNGGVVWAEQWWPPVLALLITTVPLWMVLMDMLRGRRPGGSRSLAF